MVLIARASTSVRNKNLIIVAMSVLALCWFAYDGFVGYPRGNDRLVGVMKNMLDERPPRLAEETRPVLESWPGWDKADDATRQSMDNLARNQAQVEGWKSALDITIQKWIVLGLVGAVIASLWWFLHCQKRRVVAEEDSVSPGPGIVIPWEKITRVDNTRWKTSDIVDVTYTDEAGKVHTARFDGYELEYEPLVAILERLGDKAIHAEFIPKEAAAPTAPGAPESSSTSAPAPPID